MNDKKLSMFLWGEETMTSVYVHNRSPHRILKNMTPEEAKRCTRENIWMY
jgi:hypothetical protein